MVSDYSRSGEESQLLPTALETRSAEEKKKAKNNQKDKDEKDVETLAGSFMKIISLALAKDEEIGSKIW